MFILVTPMTFSGVDMPNPGDMGTSHKPDISSRSSSSHVTSFSIMRCWLHVCTILRLLMSLRRRISWSASCWSRKRISACERRNRNTKEHHVKSFLLLMVQIQKKKPSPARFWANPVLDLYFEIPSWDWLHQSFCVSLLRRMRVCGRWTAWPLDGLSSGDLMNFWSQV